MQIDKELYRKAYREYYPQWNIAEKVERAHNAGQLTPLETWRQYVSLWESVRKMGFTPGKWQRTEKLIALDRYYKRIQQMETWRRIHG
ncbi:MAG: hypothetical protein H8D34_00225 [Chloroflexi bacterium]|nr:hypothetical protein [Chloroflexota bacterium]